MKRLIAATFCLLAAGAVFAQTNTSAPKSATPQNGAAAARKGTLKKSGPAVGGFILDARKQPVAGVEAFIYAPDSSIIASGYTDATGHYETNAISGGKYTVKIVYPSYKAIVITGVVIKAGVTPLNITAAEPEADTTLPFTNFIPVAEKKKPRAGAQKR